MQPGQASQIHPMFGVNVDVISRFAQWRIESLTPNLCWKSHFFKIGAWNWRLQIKKCGPLHVWLFRENLELSDHVPVATFILRVLHGPGLRQVVKSTVIEKTFNLNEYHAWPVETGVHGKFVVEVEFLELKSGNAVEAAVNLLPGRCIQPLATQGVLNSLRCMLETGLHTDITIRTAAGDVGAHLAILAARSKVFQVMFSHDLRERKTFTIEIQDMSLESLKALLAFLYGSIDRATFDKHRLSLLGAADKYDIGDLKEACEQSLMEDINSENVLQRLQNAWMYHLCELKKECMRYLFEFGKVYDIRAEFDQFLQSTDKDLIIEMFQEGLNAAP